MENIKNVKIKLMSKKDKNNRYLIELPDDILDAINRNNLIIFTGAGLSKLYGLPLWNELGERLINLCLKKNIINYSTKNAILKNNLSPMQMVTYACKKLDDYDGSGHKEICDALKKVNIKKAKEISKCLASFGCPIITTNADLGMESSDYFKSNNYDYLPEDLETEYKGIVHIHGSINAPNKMVFTAEDYLDFYNPYSDRGKSLKRLFDHYSNKAIMFIGYGMSEFELIKYFASNNKKRTGKTYFLNGYYSNETNRIEIDKEYYKSLNIELIPYYLDEEGFYQLVLILKHWNKQIEKLDVTSSIAVERLNKILKQHPSNSNKKELLEIYDSINMKNVFFNLLCKSKYIDEWSKEIQKNTNIFSVDINYFRKKDNQKDFLSVLSLLNYINYLISNDIQIDDLIMNNCVFDIIKEIVSDNSDEIEFVKNSMIIEVLIEIVLSNKEYVLKTNVKDLIIKYIRNTDYGVYELIEILNNRREIIKELSVDEVFEIYKALIEETKEIYISANDFMTDGLKEVISDNPFMYYEYTKKSLINERLIKYVFDNIDGALREEYNIYFEILKFSISKLLNEDLKKEFKACIKSNNDIENRIAFIMCEIRYEDLENELWSANHIDRKSTFQDVIDLFKNTNINENYKDDIRKYIKESSFDNNDNDFIKKLREYLLFSLERKEITKETLLCNEQEYNIITNYGKYFYEPSFKDNTYIYDRIKNLELEDLEKEKERLMKEQIPFFEEEWIIALSKYMLDGEDKTFLNSFEILKNNRELATSVNYLLYDKSNISYLSKRKYLEEIIKNVSYEKKQNLSSISFLIYNLEKARGNTGELYSVVKKLDIKRILSDETLISEDITGIVNTIIYNLVIVIVDWINNEKDISCDALLELCGINDEIYIPILAFVYNRLSEGTKGKNIIFDTIIKANIENKHLVYECLGNQTLSEKDINKLGKRKDFLKYLKGRENETHNRNNDLYFSSVMHYFMKGKCKTLFKYIVCNCNHEINRCIINYLNHYSTSLDVFNEKMLEASNVIELSIDQMNKNKTSFKHIDDNNLIYNMCLMNNKLKIKNELFWRFLLELFKNYKVRFVNDEIKKTLKCSNTKCVEYALKMVTILFDYYSHYRSNDILLDIYNYYYESPKYNKYTEKWYKTFVKRFPSSINDIKKKRRFSKRKKV